MSFGVAEIIALAVVTAGGALWGMVTATRQGLGGGRKGLLVSPMVGASMGRWASGCFLFAFIVAWIVNVLLISGCAGLSPENDLMFDGCHGYASVRFVAFSEFQSGLGGLIGLLGVAWAAAYKMRPEFSKEG